MSKKNTIPDEQIRNADPGDLIKCYGPWLWIIANRYSELLKQTGALDTDDLFQAGSMALLEAQKRYDPAAGASFLSFSFNPVRGAMRRALGFSQDGQPPRTYEYYDEPLQDDAEATRFDLIPDTKAEPLEDRAERLELYDLLHEAVDNLPNDRQREAIDRVYFRAQPRTEAAAEMGIKYAACVTAEQLAFSKLRKNHRLRDAYMPSFSTSLHKFQLSFTSAVEAAVIWKEEHSDQLLSEQPNAKA